MPISIVRRKEVHSLDDIAIIIRIVDRGEQDLLEVIYDRYVTKVYYKCLSIVGEKATAQDLAHDVMVKILINLSTFQGKAGFSTWVHSITYNHCMDYLKRKKKILVEDIETSAYKHVSTEEIELENKILRDLQLTQLEVLLEELRPEDKLILLMRYQDSMSVKQIAQTLKIGIGAVKMRLKRSRDRLAELLKTAKDDA